MNLLTWVGHFANFFAAPLGVAALTVLLARGWVWRQALRGAPWRRLWLESAVAALLGQMAGLLIWGAEGKLAGYALMLAALSLPLAWRLRR
ncbi:hypothetical protein HNQ51_000641 [Inhella inkyongensis]|uniref:Uncharacterized protein n=1 Tax=Inhella inkyongensis TaxID=392593 RepID=A0A840S1Q3_9BURK|nr:hypothetical protein [Inhella inkyongensis]MBB5203348.1 hypothetical protein [Inhella inkyongensis]